jgi:hypothetical protein
MGLLYNLIIYLFPASTVPRKTIRFREPLFAGIHAFAAFPPGSRAHLYLLRRTK